METKETSERNYGIEWLRMISMFMVVLLHINGHGGILGNSQNSNLWLISNILEALCIIAVNLFALTTGYLYFNKKIKIKNILNLWLEIFFYSVGIAIVFYAFKLETFDLKEFLKFCFPIYSEQYWYFKAYFFLFLLMPLLNIVINKTSKKKLLSFIFVFFISLMLFCVQGDIINLLGGYSTTWLAFLYLVGGAIGKYKLAIKIKGKQVRAYVYLLLYIFVVALSLLCGYFVMQFRGVSQICITSYISVFNTLGCVFFFLFFINIKFQPNKIISFLSKTSFGVYLIHEHAFVRAHCMTNRFMFVLEYNPFVALLIILGSALAIYLACSLVEFARQMLFKLCRVNKATSWVDKKLCDIYDKIKIEEDVNINKD